MPAALLRNCSYPGGCGELVTSGRCAEHRKQQDQARGVKGAPKENWRWRSWKWRTFSRTYRRKYPLCGQQNPEAPATTDSGCAAERRAVEATDVDHIQPVAGPGDALAFALRNLQGLCHACHSAKTLRENRA